MYLRKIKQFNLCFYRLCSLIPMNIDKLIVNCVVDTHTVETRNECVFYVFVVSCVVDSHMVETLVIGYIFAMRRYLPEMVVINRGQNC